MILAFSGKSFRFFLQCIKDGEMDRASRVYYQGLSEKSLSVYMTSRSMANRFVLLVSVAILVGAFAYSMRMLVILDTDNRERKMFVCYESLVT